MGNVCLYGKTSAFELDTGYLDSSLLGINEAHRCEFRLKKTCAPLVVKKPYARFSVADNGTMLVEYYYGDIFGFGHVENQTFAETYPVPSLKTPTWQYSILYVFLLLGKLRVRF
jgi:hypothetical protein